jgi:hypothetical protein
MLGWSCVGQCGWSVCFGWLSDWDEVSGGSVGWSRWCGCRCGWRREREEGVVIAGVAPQFEHVSGRAKALGLAWMSGGR